MSANPRSCMLSSGCARLAQLLSAAAAWILLLFSAIARANSVVTNRAQSGFRSALGQRRLRADRVGFTKLTLAMLGALPLFSAGTAVGVGFDKLPKITTHPKSVTIAAGGEVVLFARAYAAGEPTFQWLRHEVPVPGATEPVLRLKSLTAADADEYRIVVANSYGKATSDVARVIVEENDEADFSPADFSPAVLSCNAVGYINLSLAPGFTLVAIQLLYSLPVAGAGEAVSNMLAGLPDGMAIHQVATNGFTANARLGSWRDPAEPLPFGSGFFVFNPFDEPVTLTTVGEVVQGDLRQVLPVGYSVAASLVPDRGRVATDLLMPAESGDEVWRWEEETQSYRTYELPFDTWEPEEPIISVGEAFVVRKEVEAIWRRLFFIDFGSYGGCPSGLEGPVERLPMASTSGELHLFTYHPNPGFGRVDGVGSEYFGQLYVGLSTNEAELSAAGVPVQFLDGAQRGYLNGGIVTEANLPAGRVVQAQLRVWRAADGASYEAAVAAGGFNLKSDIVSTRAEAPLVAGQPSIPPRPVNHFRTLRPPEIPRFLIEPVDLAVAIGHDATFSVAATGAAPLSYQWRRDGVAIPGATGPELRLTDVQRSDAGNYSVLLSNALGVLSSTNGRLVVYQPIQILAQPADTSRVAGETAQFSVSSTGEPPLTYRWHTSARDPLLTNRLLNATNALLVLPDVVDQAEGDYWVEVRSPYDSVTSGRAHLDVTNYLHLALDTPDWSYVTGGNRAWQATDTAHLERTNVATVGPLPPLAGYEAWMETQIDGPGVLTFWWARTARPEYSSLSLLVDGLPKASLSGTSAWESAAVALSSGSHRVTWRLHNRFSGGEPGLGWVDGVAIRPGVAPTIVQAPADSWITPGAVVALIVVAAGDLPLSYQWFVGTDPIPGPFGETIWLVPDLLGTDRPYSVSVSNYFGAVTSAPWFLRPRPTLRIEVESAGTFRLVWPSQASQFVLEQNTSLTGSKPWSVVPQPVVCPGTECMVSLPSESATNKWFRLRLQESK